MKKGLGFFLLFYLSLMTSRAQEIIQDLNLIRQQDVSEEQAFREIQFYFRSLDELSTREAKALIRNLSDRLEDVFSKLEKPELEPQQRNQLRAEGRRILSQALAIVLRTPNWTTRIESWLEENRKTYMLLSEAFVVAAAILGTEIAFKIDSSVSWIILKGFAISLLSVAAVIIPARWLWRSSANSRIDRLAVTLSRNRSLQELAASFGYPQKVLECHYSLSKLKHLR